MNTELYPLSQLRFEITSIICTNGGSLKCFSGGRTESEPRIVHEHEWVLFLSDGGKTKIDDEVYEIHAGDLRLLKPGQTVNSVKFGDVLVLHFKVSDNRKNGLIESLPSIHHFENLDVKIYCDLFDRMLSEYVDGSEVSQMLLKSRFYDLLAFVFKSAKQNRGDKKESEYIEKAKDYINKNYALPLTLQSISASVNLHPNYFHKIFKNSLGITPREYLTKIRLNSAKSLLLSTVLSVEEISLKCGFDSASYFIKLFKKEYAITPALYREKMMYRIE